MNELEAQEVRYGGELWNYPPLCVGESPVYEIRELQPGKQMEDRAKQQTPGKGVEEKGTQRE